MTRCEPWEEVVRCFRCDRELPPGQVATGMNMPGVTPGAVYWCFECDPPGSAAETTERLANFMVPPRGKEPGDANDA